MILLEQNITYTAADEHQHKYYSFNVPQGLSQLTVRFTFAPFDEGDEGLDDVRAILKKDAPYQSFTEQEILRFLPLRNHFGLSVDSPKGWVGTAHRHDNNQCHIISAEAASYGFPPTEIYAGEWAVTLSLNAVVTPYVNVYLRVEGE